MDIIYKNFGVHTIRKSFSSYSGVFQSGASARMAEEAQAHSLVRSEENVTDESNATEQEVEGEASEELGELYVSDDTDDETDTEADEAEEEEEEAEEKMNQVKGRELVAAMAARMLEEMRGRQGARAGQGGSGGVRVSDREGEVRDFKARVNDAKKPLPRRCSMHTFINVRAYAHCVQGILSPAGDFAACPSWSRLVS